MASAFTTNGALPKSGGILSAPSSIIFKANSPNTRGVPSNVFNMPANPAGTSILSGAGPKIGTNPGMLYSPAPTTPVKSTTDASGSTTTYHAPKSDPNVLAQQQALNAQGAGLVEDGIAGPKTEAAIAKYGTQINNGTSNSSQSGVGTSTGAITNQQTQNSTVDPTTGVNANGSTTGTTYTPPNQGTTGVSQGGIIGNLINTANNESPEVTQARQNLQDLQNKYAQDKSNIAGTAGFLTQQNGEEGILDSKYATLLGAAQNAVTNSLNSQAQGITANTNAGNLNAPVSQFGVLTNPTTGQPINGQSATDAAINGGTIQGLQSGAAIAASAAGNIESQQAITAAGYKSALQQGQNLQSQVTDLITSFGLNPNDINAVNSGLQTIARNTSSPQYKILSNYVNDIANTYAQILTPPGGSATDTTRGIAASMLDATASGQSIIQVMKSLDQAAQAKIAGVPTIKKGLVTNSTSGFGWNG